MSAGPTGDAAWGDEVVLWDVIPEGAVFRPRQGGYTVTLAHEAWRVLGHVMRMIAWHDADDSLVTLETIT